MQISINSSFKDTSLPYVFYTNEKNIIQDVTKFEKNTTFNDIVNTETNSVKKERNTEYKNVYLGMKLFSNNGVDTFYNESFSTLISHNFNKLELKKQHELIQIDGNFDSLFKIKKFRDTSIGKISYKYYLDVIKRTHRPNEDSIQISYLFLSNLHLHSIYCFKSEDVFKKHNLYYVGYIAREFVYGSSIEAYLNSYRLMTKKEIETFDYLVENLK